MFSRDRGGRARTTAGIALALFASSLVLVAAAALLPPSEGRLSASTETPVYASARSDQALEAVDVRVDTTLEHQVMQGFGAYNKALWYTGPAGDTLTPSVRATALEAIYGQVRLTTGNIDVSLLESPGDYGRRSNDDRDPFHFNWAGFQTQTVEAAKRLLMDPAQPYGFEDYYLQHNVNLKWTSPWLSALRRSDYGRYLDEVAEQVAAEALYWRDSQNIVTPYFMLFNEPTSGNGELGGGSVQEVVDIVKRAGARLEQEGFAEVKFVVPNEATVARTLRVSRALLEDPDARRFVGAIGYHPYPYGSAYASIPRILEASGAGTPDAGAVAERNELRDLSRQYGVPVWMTEVSHGEVDPRSFESLRGRAIHIHDELAHADASAYLAMHNMWDTTSQQLHFNNTDLFSEDSAVVLIDNATESVHITGMGYALGHYARWIKKGAVRVEEASADPLVHVSAFRDDAQGRVVLVVINNSPEGRTVNVQLNGVILAEELTGEQSTASTRWQPLAPFAPTGPDGFTVDVPGESVTTVAGSFVR